MTDGDTDQILATYAFKAGRIMAAYELHKDKLVVSGREGFTQNYRKTFDLNLLSPDFDMTEYRDYSKSGEALAVGIGIIVIGMIVTYANDYTGNLSRTHWLSPIFLCFAAAGIALMLLSIPQLKKRKHLAFKSRATGQDQLYILRGKNSDEELERFARRVAEQINSGE